jgi:hypothetical protein
MQFLCRLSRRFADWVFKSRRVLSSKVEDHEPLARFIFSGEHFAQTKGLVKPKAFLPDPTGETSVFRTFSLSAQQIWAIGNSIRSEKSKAYGNINAAAVRSIGLSINPATEDHPRHAVIVDWPQEKDKKLSLALQLSRDASLHVQV